MAYTITTLVGDTIGTIEDGTVNTTSTSLALVGRNYSNYGQVMTDNLVRLLENFANVSAPANPLIGQIWWDTDDAKLKVSVDGNTTWRVINGATSQPSAPTTTTPGDLWWDSDDQQLFAMNDGGQWILIGPGYKNGNGESGAIWETITGTDAVDHHVVTMYLDGVRTAIISSDSEFTPAASGILSAFGNIKFGWNFNSSYVIYGTANNASYLGNQPAANFWRNNQNNSGTGTLTIANDNGITVGLGNDLQLAVDGTDVHIKNNTNGGDIGIYANVGGVSTRYLFIDGSSGNIEVAAQPVSTLGIATKGYVDDAFVDAVLTGISVAPTATPGTNTTQIATTAFVREANVSLKSYVDGLNIGIEANLALKANIASPTLTGVPRSVTMPAGTSNTAIATTAFVSEANVSLKSYVDGIDALKANIAAPTFTGAARAVTMPEGTANTAIATTDFVVNNSGFLKNKIYVGSNAVTATTHMTLTDTGAGYGNLVIDGNNVLDATATGVALRRVPTAVTASQVYDGTGNTMVATTQYVKTATTWWGGSAKFVSDEAPVAGVNDGGSNNGDFWFQYE